MMKFKMLFTRFALYLGINIFMILVGIYPKTLSTLLHQNTELMHEQNDPLLIFSTLNGSLVGVGQKSGEIRWHHDDEPVVKLPLDVSGTVMPMFLPDPKDGSLYLYGAGSEALKKLPFTIPQLVANSPCRSSDGILYTGRKIDTWFSVNSITGEKEQLLSFNKVESICPMETEDVIFIGRTEYNIIMVDSKQKHKKWNITFYDYSAAKMRSDEVDNYDSIHFTSSSEGRVVTLDQRSGSFLWELNLGSPVIAIYIISSDGLITVPFTSVADDTMDTLLGRFKGQKSDFQLHPTLYIGQHRHGLYALPSLIDINLAKISTNSARLLIEGPMVIPQLQKNENHIIVPGDYIILGDINAAHHGFQSVGSHKNVILLGHYQVPQEYLLQNQPLQITGRSDQIIQNKPISFISDENSSVPSPTKENDNGTMKHKSIHAAISAMYHASKQWINQQENKGLKLALIILVGCIITMFWYLNVQFKEFQQLSQGSRENSRTSSNGKTGLITMPEEIGEGLVRVGKITFNTDEVLGKGCEGTFVYKGEFDGRSVAVKRLLPDCFVFADREVALLRESDAHAHVVRYFCTEQDRMFRYIALELAEATLQDYVVGTYDKIKISPKNILRQATSGLAHLHLLGIVHRDIKPHNVLISMPGPRQEVRAMISDFGLCKKLQLGRISFSRRSGVTGTDGWIAPEMLNGERTTCAVDIFSLGCVFYYVLSNGKHPFGDSLRRQSNILCGESDLMCLQGSPDNDKELSLILIKSMIASNPSDRPPAMAVYNHPNFWDHLQILTFFQDVSDRVEKDELDSPALLALEKGGLKIVEGDWRSHIDYEVAADLRKYRSYNGGSVRDLLRALRNKKHHYRELTREAQESLGEIPVKFTEYWLARFPRLLSHVWCAMQCFRIEPVFSQYYHSNYTFHYETNVNEESVDQVAIPTPAWRVQDPVNWGPNKIKYRPQRRRQDKRKVDGPIEWILPNDKLPNNGQVDKKL